MKKLISFLALTLCLAVFVLAFGVSAASAPTVNAKVNGIAVPAAGGKISGKGIEGNISYDASTKTLTLDNATITADDGTGILIISGVENIVLNGTNEIKWATDDLAKGHTAIRANNLNISGSGVSDSLKITAVCTTSDDARIINQNYLLCIPGGVSINNCSLDILLTPNYQDGSHGCDFTAIHSANGSVGIKNSRVNIVVGKDKAGNITYTKQGACIYAVYMLEIENSEINAGIYSNKLADQCAALQGSRGITITNSVVNAVSEVATTGYALRADGKPGDIVIKNSVVNAHSAYKTVYGGLPSVFDPSEAVNTILTIENSSVEFTSKDHLSARVTAINISGSSSISYTDTDGKVTNCASGADIDIGNARALSVKAPHTHCVCGNLTHTGDILHSAVVWTAWDSANSLPSKPGSYYLTKDVTLTNAWKPTGNISLCLNGKTVTNSRGSVIDLSTAGSKVSVADCTGSGTISGGGARTYSVTVGNSAFFNLHGGKIVSSGAGCVSVNRSTGRFNMFGGTLGNGSESGYAVSLTYGGLLNAASGKINAKVDARDGVIRFGGTEFTSEIMVCHTTPMTGTPVLSGNGQIVYYYNVSIGSGDTETEITSKNKDDILGDGKLSFEYDAASKKGTLTLSSASLESDTYSPISAGSINTLEIVLRGENRVSSPYNYCITAQNLIFSGDGSLSVTTTEPYNVCIDCTGDITVNGGNITLSSVSYAIYIDGKLTVNDGSVIIIATDEEDGVALDYGRGTPDISISEKHMMLTGKMPNGSDAAETATTETDKISAARYIKILNTIAISYLPGADGSGSGSTVNKRPGIDFTLAGALFTRTGYTQTGWAITDGGEKVYDLGGIYTGNDPLTLYPVWTPNRYTITFDTDGGSAIDPITADYSTAVTAPAAPTKTGYTFAGWDTEIPATIPAQNITVKATWTINRYTITFDTDGGSTIDPITADYGTAVTAPAAPTKVGYIFSGWDKEIPATIPAENITVKAVWTLCDHSANKNTPTCANDTLCSECGATVPALPHTPYTDDRDCTTKVRCMVCGQTVVPAKEHVFAGAWYSNATHHWKYCQNTGCYVREFVWEHEWVDVPAKAATETEDGYTAHRICSVCQRRDADYHVVGYAIRGDVNGDGKVDKDDAVYLLKYIMYGNQYPINQSGDMNGDGKVDKDDAVYLLKYTLFGDIYPLK